MKVSIITAVYNRRGTIAQTLDSVRRQSHPAIEHVVVDGASTDGTREIIEASREGIDVFVSERDRGIYDALNKGIGLASGEVVGFLHADDFFADRDVVARIAAAFEVAGTEACYGDLDYVDAEDAGRVVRRWRSGEYSERKLHWGWMPPHPTFYARRDLYGRHGGFDTALRIAADYDCMLRFLGPGGIRPVYIPHTLVKMRLGGMSNASLRNVLRKSREDLVALRRNKIGGVGALAWKNLSKVGQFLG